MESLNKKRQNDGELKSDKSETIEELIRATELWVSRKEKPGDGIMADARYLARQWKSKKRPVFEGYAENNLIMLLAGLVVALREDHNVLKQIRKHRPNDFEKLRSASSLAEGYEIVFKVLDLKPSKPTPKQAYELKRAMRGNVGDIELQFGTQEAWSWLQKQGWSNPIFAPSPAPFCLDEIFAGQTVTMLRLQQLFGIDRHRLGKLGSINGKKIHKTSYGYRVVAKIIDRLLKEKPAKQPKRPGRPPRKPWLNQQDLRTRVLTGIEARINSLSVPERIKTEFLAVVHRNLPDSGKQ